VVDVSRSGPRLPNLLIIGVSKAGTTSLFDYLQQHPEICASDVKELYYFAPLRHGGALEPPETYAAHFRHCRGQRYALEGTPGYFYGGAALARGIDEICEDAQVLLSLRAPSERCWSWFRFQKARTRLPRDLSFEEYLDRCERLHEAGLDGEVEHRPFWGLGGGCYDDYLPPWLDRFGPRLRIVFFDDLVAAPRPLMRSLFTWLDIDAAPADDLDVAVENRTVQPQVRVLQAGAMVVNRRAEALFRRHPSAKRRLRTAYYAVNRSRSAQEAMSGTARSRLADFYRPHNQRLAAQLTPQGLQLPPGWW
jgi:hypothetical protein